MSTVLEEFVGKLGWQVDKTGPAEFKKQASGIGKGMALISAAYTAAAGVVTGFLVSTNKHTKANYDLAKSIGVSYEWLHRWNRSTESVGIGAQGVTTAIGFMNKQIGNVKAGGADSISQALGSIGLSFEDIKQAAPETAFNAIVSALGKVEDQSISASAAAKLFGRGSGMAFSRLGNLARANGQTIDEYLGRYDDLQFQTEASVKGAVDFAKNWGAINIAIDEAKIALAGLIGEGLAPALKSVRSWITENRELLKQKIVEWARSVAKWLKDVWSFLSKIGGLIGTVIGKVGGLGTALKMVVFFYLGSKFISATKNVTNLGKAFGTVATKAELAAAKTALLKTGLLAIAAIAFDDLMQSLEDISAPSWGNKFARLMLNLSDRTAVWVGEMTGLFFKSDAERAKYIAAQAAWVSAATDDLLSNVGIFVTNVQNAISRLTIYMKGAYEIAFKGSDPAKVIEAMKKSLKNFQPQSYQNKAGKVVSDYAKSYRFDMAHDSSGPGTKDKRAGNSVNVNAPITVHAAPGMDEKKIGEHVTKQIEKHVHRAVRTAEAAGVAR